MAYDFNGAIKAGVPLNEITDYVAGKADYDLAGARDAGISDKDILGHLGVNVGPAKPEQSSIGAGWKTAWQQLPQLGYGLAGAAAATLESMAGEGGMATAAKDWSVKGYQDWGSKIQLNAKDNYEFDTAYDKAKNGDFGALVDWMGYGLGYVAGQGVQMLGTAGVGSLVGKAALKGVAESFAAKAVETSTKEILAAQATKGLTQEAARKLAVQQVAGEFGQTAAIGASAFGMEGGEIGGDIAEKSVREGRVLTGSELAQAFGATILAGSLEFVGDKIGLSGMTGKLPFGKAASEMGGFGGRAARGLIGGTMAAPAEFATEYGQTLAEEWGKGNDPFSDDAKRQALNAGALGAMGGSVHGVGGGLISAPRKVDPISEIETSPTVAGAIDKMTQAVDEANLNLTAATDSYLAPPAAPEIPPAAPVSEGPLTGPNETWRNTLDAASTGLTEFDRQNALEQLNPGANEPGPASKYVDLKPMDAREAENRIGFLRSQAADAGGNALELSVVPHPSVAGKFAIGTQELPDLNLTGPKVPPAVTQYRLESAALVGNETSRKAADNPRQVVVGQALRNIESRNGVASPAEAQLLQEAGRAQDYDRVDPALAGTSSVDHQLTAASGIVLQHSPRETTTTSGQTRQTEMEQQIAARKASDAAQADRTTTEQIAASSQPAQAPHGPDVVKAFETPPAMRSASQVALINQARGRLSASDFSALQMVGEQGGGLPHTMERIASETSKPIGPAMPAPIKEGGLSNPSTGRIVRGAKLSTDRTALGTTGTVTDNGVEHQYTITPHSALGGVGKTLQNIARIFGKQLVTFKSDTLKADGFVQNDDNKSIYINANSKISPLAVFGHELMHLLKRDNPIAYKVVAAIVARNVNETGAHGFRNDYSGQENGPNSNQELSDSLVEEMASDLMGNRFQEEDFWTAVFKQIAEENPEEAKGIIARLSAAVAKAINAVMALTKGPGFRADSFVKDLNEIKSAMRNALVAYAQQQKIPAMQMEAERMRAEGTVRLTGVSETDNNQSSTNQGEQSAKFSNAGRGEQLGQVREGNRSLAPEDRGNQGGEIPSYGNPREGSVELRGIHFSNEARSSLSSQYYGSGLKGAEWERVSRARDARLRERVYFYVDAGNGVMPESGLGNRAHAVDLQNIYDPRTNQIKTGDENSFESAVIDAGFDGYFNPTFGRSGAVVLLGRHSVPVSPTTVARPGMAVPGAVQSMKKSLLSREMRQINTDNIPGARIENGNLEIPPGSRSHANAELSRIGSSAQFSSGKANAREPMRTPFSPARKVDTHVLHAVRGERETSSNTRVGADEKSIIRQVATKMKMSITDVEHMVRDHKAAHPASAGWAQLVLTGAKVNEDTGKGELQYQIIPYSFNLGTNGRSVEVGTSEYAAKVANIAQAMMREVRSIYERAMAGDNAAKKIIAQSGWYKEMRTRLRQEFGGLGDLFADLLGATSPNTPVRTNWDNSIEALRLATNGAFDHLMPKWVAWADNADAMDLRFRAFFNEMRDKGLTKAQIKRLGEYKWLSERASEARTLPDELLPVKDNGKKFGFNGQNVVRAMVDLWRVVKNADPDINRGGTAPKAINFSGNLIGFRDRATIDVWAARMLQRLSGGLRIPSMAESGVSGEALENGRNTLQFGFGQDVFSEAVRDIRNDPDLNQDQVLASINDDDLQALVWFIEKEVWTKGNWTSAAGEGGSFEFEADLAGISDRDRVNELRKTADSSVSSTAEQRAKASEDINRIVGEMAAIPAIANANATLAANADWVVADKAMPKGQKLSADQKQAIRNENKDAQAVKKKAKSSSQYKALESELNRAKSVLKKPTSESRQQMRSEALGDLGKISRPLDRYTVGLSIQKGAEQGMEPTPPSDAEMAQLAEDIKDSVISGDPGASVIGLKAIATEGRYGAPERALDLEAVVRDNFNARPLAVATFRAAEKADQDAAFVARVLRPNESFDPKMHRPGVEIYFRDMNQAREAARMMAEIAGMRIGKPTEFGPGYFEIGGYTIVVDGRPTAESRSGQMGNPVGMRVIYMPEFEARYGMDDRLKDATDQELEDIIDERTRTLRVFADSVLRKFSGVSFAGVFGYEIDTRFSGEYQGAINDYSGSVAGKTDSAIESRPWRGRSNRESIAAATGRLSVDGSESRAELPGRNGAEDGGPAAGTITASARRAYDEYQTDLRDGRGNQSDPLFRYLAGGSSKAKNRVGFIHFLGGRPALATVYWRGDLAGGKGFFTSAIVGETKDGRDALVMHIFPEEAIVDGSPRDVQRAIRSGASVLNVAAAQIKPGTWEVSTNGAKPGDAYHDSMVASSELTPLGEGYSRLAVPQGTTANDLLREGVRRLVASLDGNVPDITFKRETGANPSDEVRTISADRIDARFSTQRQTDTPQFKAWFGEWTDPKAFTSKAKGPVSQAVDESGSPLVLYHATNGDFSEFEAGRPTINSTTFGDVETERHAIFTSPNEQFAEGYIRKGDGGNVMPVYMDIKAPMDLREGVPGEVINDIVENSDGAITHRDFYHLPADETWSLFDGEFGKNFVDAARKAGYDGAITTENDPDTGNSVEVYAAFDSTQLKSAIGNSGNFDGTNPDITKSAQRQIETPEFKRWFDKSMVVGEDGKPQVMYHATYRGGFSEFDRLKSTEWRVLSMDSVGSWFSDTPSEDGGAGMYGSSEGASIYPVYLSIQNARVYTTFDDFLREMHEAEGRDFKDQNPRGIGSTEGIRAKLKALGYDGIAFQRTDNQGLMDDISEWRDALNRARAEEYATPKAERGAVEMQRKRIEQTIKTLSAELDAFGSSTEFDKQYVWIAFDPTQIKSAIGNNGQFDPANPDITKSTQRGIELRTDVPNERWLQEEIEYAKSKGSNRFGVPYMSKMTASWTGGNPIVPVSILAEIKGERGEQSNVRKDDLAWLKDEISKNGFENVGAPYIEVGYDGVPWVSEGNHRIMAASELGIESMPVEVRYFDGGERIAGEMNPDKLLQMQPEGAITQSTQRTVDNSGRDYTPEQQAMHKNIGRTVEVPTIKERLQEARKGLGMKLAQGLVDQFAPIKSLSKEAYGLARLAKGAAGAIEAFLHHGKLRITDGVYDADQTGGVVERLGVPLHGEMGDFLTWIAGNRAERLTAEGKENLFTKSDIDAAKSLSSGTTDFDYTIQNGPGKGHVTRDRTKIYNDSLKTFNDFNKNVLDIAEQSGLIDGTSRPMWENEFYVPFYRVAEDDAAGGFAGAKSNALVRQQAFKKLKGGTDKLNSDLLGNTLQNWSHLIEASAKNRAAQATLAAAEKLGIATEVQAGTKGAVWVMESGKQKHYEVSDPMLMAAITSLEYAGMKGPLMKALSATKHWLTIGVTASPVFKVRNLIRDSIQAIGTSDLGYNVLGNLKQGWNSTKRDSQTYVSMLASGAHIRFGAMMDGSQADHTRRLIKNGVKDSTILDSDHKVQAFVDKFISPAVEAYNEIGSRGEEINRAALYKQLTAKGMSHAEASLMARDLMDFSMQGSWQTVRFLTQVVPFMNARLQGMYKLGRAAKEDPAKFAVVLGAVAFASVALMAAYSDDDDWKKREDWDRDNNWWFKFGGTAFRVPKPFEIGAIGTLAERGVEYFTNPEMTGNRLRERVLSIIGNNLNMNPIPQAFKPIIDVYSNKDSFTGRPIETMGMDKLNPDYRYTQNTSMPARALSTAGQAVTSKVGIDFLSPVQVDHIVRGYFSWLGSFVVGAADRIIRPLTNEAGRAEPDYWKVATQGMVSSNDMAASRYVSQMYDQAKVLEEAYGTYRMLAKTGRREEAQAYMADHKEDLQKYKMVEHVKQTEAKLNERQRMIERSNLSPEDKRIKIMAIRDQKDQIARRIAPGYR